MALLQCCAWRAYFQWTKKHRIAHRANQNTKRCTQKPGQPKTKASVARINRCQQQHSEPHAILKSFYSSAHIAECRKKKLHFCMTGPKHRRRLVHSTPNFGSIWIKGRLQFHWGVAAAIGTDNITSRASGCGPSADVQRTRAFCRPQASVSIPASISTVILPGAGDPGSGKSWTS